MDQVIIRLIDLPNEIHGAVREDAEGDYNVYINAKLAPDQRAQTLQHELRHIVYRHLDEDPRPVEVKEMEAEYGCMR